MAALVALCIAVVWVTSGVPSLSGSPETARWQTGGGFLFGLPDRLASIGGAIVAILICLRYGEMKPQQRRLSKLFFLLQLLFVAGQGFRGGLLELIALLAIALSATYRPAVGRRTLLYLVSAVVPAVALFAFLGASYTSSTASEQASRGVVGAVADRATVGTARSSVVVVEFGESLGYGEADRFFVLPRDMRALATSYIGGPPTGENRLNERISAVVAERDPTVPLNGTVAPSTPGMIAVLIFLLGVPGALAVSFFVGTVLRWVLLQLHRPQMVTPVWVELVLAALLYVCFQIVFKGNIEFQILNVSLVLAFLILFSFTLRSRSHG